MRTQWVMKEGLLHSFLVVVLFLGGVVCLFAAYDHFYEFGIEHKWRRDGQAATGVVTGLKDGFRGEGVFAGFYRFAAVRIEGSDGVVYQALMDRDVGSVGSTVDVVYLIEEDLFNFPDKGYVLAQARPLPPAYLSYNSALALAAGLGLVITGIFLLWSGRWMHRNEVRSEKKHPNKPPR